MVIRRRFALTVVGLAAAMSVVSGCTVVKPIICAVSSPVRFVDAAADSRDLDDADDRADAAAESVPAACTCVAAPIVIPVRIVERVFNGFIGGFCSGLVSDLNVLVANTEKPTKNLTHAWATTAQTPSEAE